MKRIRLEKAHICRFAESGFTLNGISFVACGVQYHPRCVTVGAPFASRDEEGLCYPSSLAGIIPFVCESCTVRANFQRELEPYSKTDLWLLQLERMRMIDVVSAMSLGSLQTYSTQFRTFQRYRSRYGLSDYFDFLPSHPSIGEHIHISYCLLEESVRLSSRTGNSKSFNSLKGFQTALGGLHVTAVSLFSGHSTYRQNNLLHTSSSLQPTGNLASSRWMRGFQIRHGVDVKQCGTLLHSHVVALQAHRTSMLMNRKLGLEDRYLIVSAQCMDFAGYLAWLRSTECFSLRVSDVELVEPRMGGRYGLDKGDGFVGLKLLPKTKSSRALQVDVIISWATNGGLRPGFWFKELLNLLAEMGYGNSNYLFFHPASGNRMDFRLYFDNWLGPFIQRLCDKEDPYLLRQLEEDVTENNTIASVFFSFHIWRRSADTHICTERPHYKQPSATSIHDHGRWRLDKTQARNNSEAMMDRYNARPYPGRVRFTRDSF